MTRQVLITGATSGIGRALAEAVASPGAVLHLSGRDAGRLATVTQACRDAGARVEPRVLDVRDSAAMADWIQSTGRLDLVVANAGIAGGMMGQMEATRSVFATNLDGVLNTVLPALDLMRRQDPDAGGRRGCIVAIASIAAFLPIPGAAAHAAAKADVDRWMVASAPAAARDGIGLISVCPGCVRTPMTARNRFPMPGLMDADAAARRILRGIDRGRRRVTFPWHLAAIARIGGLLPPRVLGAILWRRDRR